MLECKYVNSMGEEFVFGIENNRINKSDIRDYEWAYVEQYEKIKKFSKNLSTKSIPVFFFNRPYARYRNEMYYRAEDLYAIVERDVRTITMGKLFVGDYYVDCFVVASAKNDYNNGIIISETLSVLSDWRWRKDVKKIFGAASVFEPTSEEKDYPRDYMYDYIPGGSSRRLVSGSVAPFDFRIDFQGAVDTPTLIVGNQIYRVYTEIFEGEYLTVDSVKKTIIRTKANGEKVNEFNNRDRENYIFEKMPVRSGSSFVQWQDGKIVTITAYVERSEPKWI